MSEVMQVICVETKKDGTKCGENMLIRHDDTDRHGNPQEWYKCKNGHWRAISIKK